MESLETGNIDRYILDTTDYHDCLVKVDKHLKNGEKKRFVTMEQRKKESVYTAENIKSFCHGKYETAWRGINLMKDPLDMVIIQQLIWREKPATIIEIGAYSGACALWMADIARLNDIQCHVYALDIDISLVDQKARDHPDLTFIEGDAKKIAEAIPAGLLQKLPHPWIISEDAHVDLVGCMEYFHEFMKAGDYFIIEDTNPHTPLVSGQGLYKELGYDFWGLHKHTLMDKFMKEHHDFYAVDTHYTDYFGYNGTFNWNGYIKRIK